MLFVLQLVRQVEHEVISAAMLRFTLEARNGARPLAEGNLQGWKPWAGGRQLFDRVSGYVRIAGSHVMISCIGPKTQSSICRAQHPP